MPGDFLNKPYKANKLRAKQTDRHAEDSFNSTGMCYVRHFYWASAQLAIQSRVLATVVLSVCPSVCLSHAGNVSKRRKLGSQNLRRRIAHGVQFSRRKARRQIRKGFPPAKAWNESGVGKICIFQPIGRHISETVQDRTKVTIND